MTPALLEKEIAEDILLEEHDVVASICRDSFWFFVQEFWAEIIDEPLIENWHMPLLCEELQKLAERVFKRLPLRQDLLINIAPGTSKSTITSVMLPAWCWIRAPWVQIICGSYGHDLALDLSTKGRAIVESEKYKACFPEVKLSSTQNAKQFYQTTAGGWRFATSTGGAVTGRHGHLIIIDDPVDPQGAESLAENEAARLWLTDVIPKRKVDQSRTPTVMIMQRLHRDDPSALWQDQMKRGRHVKHICLPAEVNEFIKPVSLAARYVDGLLDPVRLSRMVLENQWRVSEHSYEAQYLQNPIPRGGGMFKTDNIEILPMDKYPEGFKLVRYWDKAGTREGGAYTAGVLMGARGKNRMKEFVILDVVRGQWEAYTREKIIRQTAEADGRRVIVRVEQEPGSGGKESAENTIRNLAGFRVAADLVGASSGNKVQRADPLASQVNGGAVKMRRADWNSAYLDEMRSFREQSKYKDQIDASTGAFSLLVGRQKYIGALR